MKLLHFTVSQPIDAISATLHPLNRASIATAFPCAVHLMSAWPVLKPGDWEQARAASPVHGSYWASSARMSGAKKGGARAGA
jgi:hypothetical protein